MWRVCDSLNPHIYYRVFLTPYSSGDPYGMLLDYPCSGYCFQLEKLKGIYEKMVC